MRLHSSVMYIRDLFAHAICLFMFFLLFDVRHLYKNRNKEIKSELRKISTNIYIHYTHTQKLLDRHFVVHLYAPVGPPFICSLRIDLLHHYHYWRVCVFFFSLFQHRFKFQNVFGFLPLWHYTCGWWCLPPSNHTHFFFFLAKVMMVVFCSKKKSNVISIIFLRWPKLNE